MYLEFRLDDRFRDHDYCDQLLKIIETKVLFWAHERQLEVKVKFKYRKQHGRVLRAFLPSEEDYSFFGMTFINEYQDVYHWTIVDPSK